MRSDFFLEILNGGAVTPELMSLVIIGIYLFTESRRRREANAPVNWLGLPPSMDLMLAFFICDAGTYIRSVTIWLWRRTGDGGHFNAIETMLLMVSGTLIIMGSLCKIRALTKPDHGAGPWLLCMGLSALVIGVLLVTH